MAKKPARGETKAPMPTDGADVSEILSAAQRMLKAAEGLQQAEAKASVRRRSDPGTARHSLTAPRRQLKEALASIVCPDGWLASGDDDALRIPIALRQLTEVVNDPDDGYAGKKLSAAVETLRRAVANLRNVEIDDEMDVEEPPGSCDASDLSKEAKALAALRDHPEWSDAQIARAAGCNRTSLYRMSAFKQAKDILKAAYESKLPHGTKDRASGQVEAWHDD